jgi:VIT1/CCC1 family predicted Fe2+/Mn2+ transporter
VDDLDYFPDGSWSVEDAVYRGYPASGGARTSGRHRSPVQPGTVLQDLADGPWSPLGAPVSGPPQAQPGGYGNGWPDIPPGDGSWAAQGAWDGTVLDNPYADTWPPQLYGAAPARDGGPRDSGAWRVPAPDGGRTGTSLLSGYAPGTGPMRQAPGTGPMRRDPGTGPMRRDTGTGPMRRDPGTGPMRRVQEAPQPQPPAAYGKALPEWLPFGSRLVLLPKETDGAAPLREHRDVSGGWLRPAVFGAMDGLVTNSSLIAGIGGGGGGHGAIVLTGIAGLIAGAFSMATGEYISVKSQNELTEAEIDLERRQHTQDRAGKLDRLTELFIDKGVSPNLAEAVARQISADPDRAVATHVREELGLDPDDLPSPWVAAGASLASFTVGALIPLSPFLVGIPSLPAALVMAGLFAFTGGAAVTRLTGRSAGLSGLRQLGAAFLATAMAFFIGHVVGGFVG